MVQKSAKNPKVLIYHTKISDNSPPDDQDVIKEAGFVSEILQNMGYETVQLPFPGNLKKELQEIKPSFIFNLVESIDGKDSLADIAPYRFEHFGFSYTGCTLRAFKLTKDKICAKKILKKEGIATPYWLTLMDFPDAKLLGKKFLIKSSINHASKDLEGTLFDDEENLRNKLLEKDDKNFFAEEYIKGREFNISVVGPIGKGEVLPPAEILFKKWPSDKLKIVDYDAKWNENSHAYKNTKRTFNFPEADKPLLEKLKQISGECWNLFDLRGYARIDFRVDEENNPYVLEINTNPCISKDAGFIAATRKSGMKKEQVIRDIIKNSCGEKFFI